MSEASMEHPIPDAMDDDYEKGSNLSTASRAMALDRGFSSANHGRSGRRHVSSSNQGRGRSQHGNKGKMVYVVKNQVCSPELKNDVLSESNSLNGEGSSYERKDKVVSVEKYQEGRSSPELKNFFFTESKSSDRQWTSSHGRKEKAIYVAKPQAGQSSPETKNGVLLESKSSNGEGSSHGRKEKSLNVEKHQECQSSHELKNEVLMESKSSNKKWSSHGRKERSFHDEKRQEDHSTPELRKDVLKEPKSSLNGKRSSHGKKDRPVYIEKSQVVQSSPEPKDDVVMKVKSLNTYDVASGETNTHPSSAQKKAPGFTMDHETLSCDTSLVSSERDKRPEDREHSGAFDICQSKVSTFSLRPSLLDTNRAKRNEKQRITEVHNGVVLRPGMVLLRNYIPVTEQVKIVKRCRDLGIGHGGFYQPGYNDGAQLHLKMMCLGKDWDPVTRSYDDHRRSDGAKPPVIPDDFYRLVNDAVKDSHLAIEREANGLKAEKLLPWMTPDICLVNFYSTTGRLGLHQDRDESRDSIREGLPVVSFSIGDSADFLYGDTRDVEKADTVVLESGDVLIFGGPSRSVFHGVTAIKPKTAPKILLDQANLRPGRLNLTFRQF